MLLNSSLNSFLDDRSIHSSCARLHRDPPPLPDELFLFLLRENKHQIKALVTPLKIWLSGTCLRHPHPEILTYRSYWMVKRSTVSILHYKKMHNKSSLCTVFSYHRSYCLPYHWISIHFQNLSRTSNFQLHADAFLDLAVLFQARNNPQCKKIINTGCVLRHHLHLQDAFGAAQTSSLNPAKFPFLHYIISI